MNIWNKVVSKLSKLFSKKSKSSKKKLFELNSKHLKRKVIIELYLPSSEDGEWSALLLNDGQDAEALNLSSTHQKFCEQHQLLIAAIHASDRLAEYGTPDILDYQGRGQKSAAYQQFIIAELLPNLRMNYPISASIKKIGLAGFSLGGLSAVAIAMNNPAVFGLVGVFSGALWWRSKVFEQSNPDANRIIHSIANGLADAPQKKNSNSPRFWFQTGTADETEDRNNNGVIDAIDDTLDLINILKAKIPYDEYHLKYVEVENGRHEPNTWSKELYGFLEWGYGQKNKKLRPKSE